MKPNTSLSLLCLFALSAFGCASSHNARVHEHNFNLLERNVYLEDGPMPILVFDQPTFSGDFQPFEVLYKSYEASDELNSLGVPNVAPWEYQRPQRVKNLGRSANLAWLLEEHEDNARSLRVDLRVVVLSGKRWRQVEGQKETRDLSPIEGEIRVRVTTLGGTEPIVTLALPFRENPLNHNADEDPDRWPELGKTIRTSMKIVTETLAKRFDPLETTELKATKLVFNPVPMFHHRNGNQPSVHQHLLNFTPLDAKAHKVRYYQYLYPSISMELIEAFQERPGGLWVDQPGPFAQAGLRRGDFVVSVQGRDALGLQTLARFVMLPHEEPIFIRVIRDDDTHTIIWNGSES